MNSNNLLSCIAEKVQKKWIVRIEQPIFKYNEI